MIALYILVCVLTIRSYFSVSLFFPVVTHGHLTRFGEEETGVGGGWGAVEAGGGVSPRRIRRQRRSSTEWAAREVLGGT